MAENPAPIGATKTAILAELARVQRENRFSPAFRDDATGGIYEHNLAARLGLIITGRGSDEDAIRADTFWRALDALQREGVITRHVRMAGFEFKSIRLTEAGLRQALRGGFLKPGWDEAESEMRGDAPVGALSPRSMPEAIRAFEPRGDDRAVTRAQLLAPRLPEVARAFRNLLFASEERDLGEGHSPISGRPDWLFSQGNAALDLVRLSPEPGRLAERAAAAWDAAIEDRLRGVPERMMLVASGLPPNPGWRARRRMASEVAASLERAGRLEPRLARPGPPETRRLTVGANDTRVDYYYPVVPGSAPVLSFVAEPAATHEGIRLALRRVAQRADVAAATRAQVPGGWRLILGLWLSDGPTLAEDSLATWWTALAGTGELRAAVTVYDEVYLLWAPAGFSPLRLVESTNLMTLA